MNSFILKILLIYPLLIGVSLFVMSKIGKKSRAVFKCFKILPKPFLLDMKVTKFVIKTNILEKILLFQQ